MKWQRIWRSMAIGVMTLSMLAASPTSTFACSCASPGPNIDVAFVGRAIVVVEGRWVRKRLRINNMRRLGNSVALLAVDNFWRGPWRPVYTAIGGTGQGDCKMPFVPGATYMIYGLERGYGPLDTNICLGSRQMDDAPA